MADKWQNEPMTSGESIKRVHLMDKMQKKKINKKKWLHRKERVEKKKDTEIVCFNDVITCS